MNAALPARLCSLPTLMLTLFLLGQFNVWLHEVVEEDHDEDECEICFHLQSNPVITTAAAVAVTVGFALFIVPHLRTRIEVKWIRRAAPARGPPAK